MVLEGRALFGKTTILGRIRGGGDNEVFQHFVNAVEVLYDCRIEYQD